ncbi:MULTISPECIES: hypothetical protein [unclassified Dysgonomonas]|uniref:hypothetical protein n=1 Tax=unclassified Dysgonomonas TaxID=2630389 RepID=UPI0024761806|nr:MULTISPECIES: hypothetical protein [unclassified Dysgonomonas]
MDRGVRIEWVDNLQGDFSFTERWSYPENVFRNDYGELVCDGICDDVLFSMRDTDGRILPDSIERYYQLLDTTHYYHTIESDADCYEWDGTDFAYAHRSSNDTVYCYTACGVSTHSSLRFMITEDNCIPSIELNSIADGGIKYYNGKNGWIRIDRTLWQKNILKAEFDFTFDNSDDIENPMRWKGRIYTKIDDSLKQQAVVESIENSLRTDSVYTGFIGIDEIDADYILPGSEKYVRQGFVLKSKIGTYDSSFRFKVCTTFPYEEEVTPVEILQRTKKLIRMDKGDICSSDYFLKVKYGNEYFIANGTEVYEKDEQSVFTFVNSKGKKLELFRIGFLRIGASNEDGLTGCDEYYPLLIKDGDRYYKIGTPRADDYYAKRHRIFYFYLKGDDTAQESIRSASLKNDTIIASIKALYQEGGAEYDLKIFRKGEGYSSSIANRIEYETE